MIGYGNNLLLFIIFNIYFPSLFPLLKEKTRPRTPPYDGGE